MNRGRYFILFTFVLLVFGSCQKQMLPDTFRIGNSYGIEFQSLDNIFTEACYGSENVTELDVDGDGKLDLKFYTYAMDSLGDLDRRGSAVWSINGDIEFGYLIEYEDLYSVKEKTDKGEREVIYNERSHYYCPDCQNLSSRKDRMSFSSPVMLKMGHGLSPDIKWSDKLQILSQFDQSRQFNKEEGNTQIYNNILTGVWDDSSEGYLPFRKKASFGNYNYGWIKIKVIDHRRIEFFEIAYQSGV